MKTPRQLGGGPGSRQIKGGYAPYDNYTGKQAKSKAAKKINEGGYWSWECIKAE